MQTLFDKPGLRQRAEAWMDDNPRIMELFERFALDMLHADRRFGISLLTERVRWECNVLWRGEFKVNNYYRAYIARRLVRKHPALNRLLTMRATKDEGGRN